MQRQKDLVFAFNTQHLREKIFDLDYKEEFMEWIDDENEKEFMCLFQR